MRKEDRLHDILEMFEIGEIDFDETDISVEQLLERNKKWHIEKTK